MKEENGSSHSRGDREPGIFLFSPDWALRLKAERHERLWSQKNMARRLTEVAEKRADLRLPSRESLARMLREWEYRIESALEGLPAQTPGAVRPDWYTRSLVYTLAGDDRRASEAQDAARRAYDAGHIMSVVVEPHRAASQARKDPERGVQHALQTLDELPAERRNGHSLSAAQLTLTTLPEEAHALPAIRELRTLTANLV